MLYIYWIGVGNLYFSEWPLCDRLSSAYPRCRWNAVGQKNPRIVSRTCTRVLQKPWKIVQSSRVFCFGDIIPVERRRANKRFGFRREKKKIGSTILCFPEKSIYFFFYIFSHTREPGLLRNIDRRPNSIFNRPNRNRQLFLLLPVLIE